MTGLIKTAFRIQGFLEERNWEFCIIGGMALQFWGEMRLTNYIDLTILTGFGGEEEFVDQLLIEFDERISDAKTFALKNRVLLLKSENEIGIDVSLGAFPFEESMIGRAAHQEYLPGLNLRICSPEDLIVSKSFADRSKDWLDISSILIKQKEIDWDYIFEQLAPLVELKEEPEIIDKLQKLKIEIQ